MPAIQPKAPKGLSAQKTVRRKGRTKAKRAALEAVPEVTQIDSDGLSESEGTNDESARDAYGKYLTDLSKNGPDLLTAEGERELGRGIQRHIRLAIDNMLAEVAKAESILKRRRIDPLLRSRAGRCLQYLNPEGLAGGKLRAQLKQRMASTDADDLFEQYAEPEGKRLRDRFIECNLRLSISMARKYNTGAIPFNDLVQDGNIGLMHAVLRFDHRKGFRFSTYAGWWIRHAVGRAIADKARTVRIPVHMTEFAALVHKTRVALTSRLGRNPTDEEIATELRKEDRRARVQKTDNGEPLVEKIRKLGTQLRQSISMDQPARTDEGDGDTLHDQMPDEGAEPPAWAPLRKGVEFEKLGAALTKLSPIERDVIRQRFGLGNDDERTFQEIGERYHLSRERIRQIQNSALDKLRRDKGLKAILKEISID